MSYLWAILALGFLIAFHELGHLLAARLFRIRVDRFAIGFGPPILSARRGGIEYSVRAFPLGGYVQIHGMNPHEEGAGPEDPTSFASKAAWKRAIVLAAGPFANYVLAVLVVVGLLLAGTHVPVELTVGSVIPAAPAARAELRPGDKILAIDGEPLDGWTGLVLAVMERPGVPMVLTVERDREALELRVVPGDDGGVGRIGIAQQYVHRTHGVGEAVVGALTYTRNLVAGTLSALWRLVRRKPGVQLSSPIGIVQATSEAATGGLDAFLRMLANISVALALFNLLPIPALDGGRLFFVGWEAATGRKVDPRFEAMVHAVGFMLLIALILWVAVGDVRRLMEPRGQAPPLAPTPAAPDAGSEPGDR